MYEEDMEPRYVISVAARLLGVESYTLRYYEKIGVVKPSRSSGNIRLYSERDVALIRRVKNLMADLGVNLAGIDVILRMAQQIGELQQQVEQLQSEVNRLRGGE